MCQTAGTDFEEETMMIRVGTVNIDTSHPMGFADAMKKDGRMNYVGVYNDSFRDDAEVEGFIARYGLEKRCGSIQELAEMCDIGFIQGCDWDEHLNCALPFIEKGKPVFIDKPLVGSYSDLKKIRTLIEQGAVILGASSARYAYEIQEFLGMPEDERGEIISVIGTSGVDEFNYGIHIVEAIGGLMGTGAEAVKYIGRGECGDKYSESYHVSFKDGRNAVYTCMTGTWQPFSITIVTTKTTFSVKIDSNRLYDALIEQVANYMEGKPNIMAEPECLIESVEIALAATASRAMAGREIKLCDLTEEYPSYDGALFKKGYAAAAGKMYAL